MNTDLLQTAKDLVKKGTQLGDPELIRMGNDLLDSIMASYDDPPKVVTIVPPVEHYICEACDSTFPVDRPNRRKCMQCGKHKLAMVVEEVAEVEEIEEPIPPSKIKPALAPPHREDMSQFHRQIRQVGNKRVRFNDEGEEEGTYAKIEQVEGVHNIWDDDGTEGHDKANEELKKLTRVSARTRKAPKKVEAQCRSCDKVFSVLGIHSGGRNSKYICDKCVQRMGRR